MSGLIIPARQPVIGTGNLPIMAVLAVFHDLPDQIIGMARSHIMGLGM